MKLVEKGKSIITNVKNNWNSPPEGKYIPYKEILSYSVGGVGVKLIVQLVLYIVLSGTSMLAGSALGLRMDDLTKLSMVAMFLNLIIVPIRGIIVDNTRSKKGKFRPYLLYAGVPTAIVVTAFAFLPFEMMSYNQRLWSLFVTYMLIQFCYPFYDQAYINLAQVMSPNTNERAEVITISTFIFSLAPSIINLVAPIIGGFTGGLEHINAYRVIMPVFGISGAALGMLSYTGTKERIIVAKDYVPKVPFFYGIMTGAKNKYNWARSIQSWFVFAQMGAGNIQLWFFYYGIKDVLNLTTEQQGALNGTLVTVLSFAATPAMLLTPLIIKKIGKRNLVIMYSVCQMIAMAGMYIFINKIWVLFVFLFIRLFFNTFPLISDPAINADVLDYQQYKTGDRLEGTMGQVAAFIGVFANMAVTYFINVTVLQNRYGLTDNYDDLFNASFREPMGRAVILIAIIGYALSLIPFITMYTLTEEEHDAHISVLKIRAALADYANNELTEGQLEEAKEIYANAVNEYGVCLSALEDSGSRRERKKLEKKKKILEIVVNEKDRFETPEMIGKIERARELLSHTVEELYGIKEPTMDEYNRANAMSENTDEEIKQKTAALKKASKELDRFHKKAYLYLEARKLMKQMEYYSNWNSIFEAEMV